jgi:NAD(P)-dependent dehydrogenase (short-subunit alcohol dehydrogenase family)
MFAEQPFKGHHAVVTGGSRGIGAAIAGAFLAAGAKVTIMGRDEKTLAESAAGLMKEHGGTCAPQTVDVGKPESIDAAFDGLDASLGAPSILINNAGVALSAPFAKTDLDFWNKIMAVDLTGAFLCIRKVLPAMLEARFGRIINISSTAGLVGYPYVSAYCAAKHGLIGLTKSLALETAKKGVTVNSVCPGYADTDVVAKALDNITSKTDLTREQALAQLVSHNPQARLIAPSEVAETVAWLALPTSGSMTGLSIPVAGGEIM